MSRSCAVVASWYCDAPANMDGPPSRPLAECYRCGEPVCRNPGCSLIVIGRTATQLRARIRMCTNCLRSERGNEATDALILAAPTPR